MTLIKGTNQLSKRLHFNSALNGESCTFCCLYSSQTFQTLSKLFGAQFDYTIPLWRWHQLPPNQGLLASYLLLLVDQECLDAVTAGLSGEWKLQTVT